MSCDSGQKGKVPQRAEQEAEMYRLKEDWREFYEETDPDRRR